jgi:hypothetical protein
LYFAGIVREAASVYGIWNLIGTDGTLINGVIALRTGSTIGPSNVFAGQVSVRPTRILLMVKGFATPLPYVAVEHFVAFKLRL